MAPPNTTSESKDPDPFKSMLSKLETLEKALAFTDVANDIPQLDSVTLKSLVTSLKKNHENNTLFKLENDSREVSSHEITDSDLTDSAVNTKGFSLQSCEVRYDNENKPDTLLLKMKEAHNNNPVTIQLYTGSHPKRISERMEPMTEDQASQFIIDGRKEALLNQMEGMLKDIEQARREVPDPVGNQMEDIEQARREVPDPVGNQMEDTDIEGDEESNEDKIKYVSLDYMEGKYRELLKEKNQILDALESGSFYKNLYVVPPRQPEGFNFKRSFPWGRDASFQKSLLDTLVSSLVMNGRKLKSLPVGQELDKKIHYMQKFLVTIDMLKENNMIHNEGAKKLELLRQYLQGRYDKWKAESTNIPNHPHHPQLHELHATITDKKSSVENRYEELHRTDSQKSNDSQKRSNDLSLSQKKSQKGY